jgi:hypothetical protein
MPSALYVTPAVVGLVAILLGGAILFFDRIYPWVRVSVFCTLLCALSMVWQSSLGLPRPTMLEPREPQGTVVSYVVDEPRTILVWLVADGSSMPRSYALPFDIKRAMQLQLAFETAKKNGSLVRMGPGGDEEGQPARGDQDRQGNQPGRTPSGRPTTAADDRANEAPVFYPEPQRADPLKSDTRVNGD